MYHILLATGSMQSKMTIGPHGPRKAASEDSVNVTAFVKNERLESTTEGSIWNLSLFSYFPLYVYHILLFWCDFLNRFNDF